MALDGGNLFVAGGRAEEIGPDVQLDVLDLMLREERRVDSAWTQGKSGAERKKLLNLLGFKNEQRYGSQLIVHHVTKQINERVAIFQEESYHPNLPSL